LNLAPCKTAEGERLLGDNAGWPLPYPPPSQPQKQEPVVPSYATTIVQLMRGLRERCVGHCYPHTHTHAGCLALVPTRLVFAFMLVRTQRGTVRCGRAERRHGGPRAQVGAGRMLRVLQGLPVRGE
jgi:hypothetical protein